MARISDWPPLRRQLPTIVRIVDWTHLVKGGYITIQPSMFSVRGMMGAEVVATRETALTARNPADVGSFSRMNCQMTSESLISFEGAFATWMTAFELPLGDGGWYATETRGGACGMPSLILEHGSKILHGSTPGISWPMESRPGSRRQQLSALCGKARVPKKFRACSEQPAGWPCRTMFRSSGLGAHVNHQITGWHSKLFKAWSMEQPGY